MRSWQTLPLSLNDKAGRQKPQMTLVATSQLWNASINCQPEADRQASYAQCLLQGGEQMGFSPYVKA
jgi:hypothetical protein